jgi:ATP phosphoribosyltransferase
VLESVTKLIANKTSWADEWKREKIENLALLIKGAIEAEGKVGIKLNVEQKNLEKVVKALPAMKNPTVSTLYDDNWVAVESILDEKDVRHVVPLLRRAGARDIIEYPLNKVIY